MRRIGKALLGLVVVLLALAVAGAIYQAIATELAERAYPPPGEMVDVGGYSLHINCVGQGSPTVILDAGSGDFSAQWVRVQREVSGTTRVCAYDRAGMGWSEMGPDPRDAKQITRRTAHPAQQSWHRRPLRAGGPFLRRHCTCKRTPPGIPTRWRAWPWSIPLPSRISSASDRKHGIATNHKSRHSPWFPAGAARGFPAGAARDRPLVVQARSGAPRIAAPAARADRCTHPLDATSEYHRTRVSCPHPNAQTGESGEPGEQTAGGGHCRQHRSPVGSSCRTNWPLSRPTASTVS